VKGVNDSPHPIRVLVVDGSAFTRIELTRMIESDPALCATETAQSGREALEKIASLRPDVVTLDIELPGMNSNGDNSDWYGFGWAGRGEGNSPRGRNHHRPR
jgi:PleD family two-component response regulator